jgi:tetratricopeptide (TPR) repeat protein
MHDPIIQSIVAYAIAVFFVIIGILTILSVFFSKSLERYGIGLTPRMKQILFANLILEIVAAGFIVFKLDPNKPDQDSIMSRGQMTPAVYSIYNQAFDQFGKANYQASIDLFSKAIELDPKNYILYLNRSVVYLQVNKNTESRADFLKGQELYETLDTQQKRREKAYGLTILNQAIALFSVTKEYEKANDLYVASADQISDTADTLLRIYNNIGLIYLENKKWSDASVAFEKAFNLSKSLGNKEMQIRTSINVSNANYWIEGQSEQARKYAKQAIEFLAIYTISPEIKGELVAGATNSLGLALAKIYQSDKSNLKLSDIINVYSQGIEQLQGASERTDTEYNLLSSLYGNRAETYLLDKNVSLAENDYKTACNRFINRRNKAGISRQLIGFTQVKLQSKSENWQDIFALAYMANKLGNDKPVVQQNEDQQLLSQARSNITEPEAAEIQSNISQYLQQATGIPKNTWQQF